MQIELIIDAFGKCSLAAKFDAIGHVDVTCCFLLRLVFWFLCFVLVGVFVVVAVLSCFLFL